MTAPSTTPPQEGTQGGQPAGQQQQNGTEGGSGAPKLEDLLADLGDDARQAVLSQVQSARSEAAKYRREAKQNSDAAAKLAELQKQNMTEPEALAEAKIRAVEAELQLSRFKVASAKRLPASAAPFLYGDDEDEIGESADALVAFALEYAKSLGSAPPPDLKQGPRGASPAAAASDPNDAFRRAIAGRRQFG